MHRHHLREHEGQACNNRKRCRSCFDNIQKKEGFVASRKKAKRVTTYCENCEGNLAMSIKCFDKQLS